MAGCGGTLFVEEDISCLAKKKASARCSHDRLAEVTERIKMEYQRC
jgi:hypothetical protein